MPDSVWQIGASASIDVLEHSRDSVSGIPSNPAKNWATSRGPIEGSNGMKKAITKKDTSTPAATRDYSELLGGVSDLLESARRASARAVNAFMTATYWEVGRRIVEHEQGGRDRAKYGDAVVERLAQDLTARLGRGFGRRNVFLMRSFYLACPRPVLKSPGRAASPARIVQTASALSKAPTPGRAIVQTLSAQSSLFLPLADLARAFPLPWSHYVLLIGRSRSPEAFAFYQTEALRGGWSVRQLQRQMDSQFYERTALSRNKAAMLAKGGKARPGDAVSAVEEIRHPLVLEFLGLRDEYSETDLEEGLMWRRGEGREWHSVWVHAARAANSLNASRNREPVRLKNSPRPAQRGEADVRSAAGEGFDRVKAHPCPSPSPSPRCTGRGNRKVPGRRNSWITRPSQTVRLVREYLTALPKEKLLSAELEKTRREIERRK